MPETKKRPVVTCRAREGEIPLSFAQQRLWFLAQLEPESPAYNIPVVRRLAGPLDTAALAGALGEIVRRHEVLRTRFPAREGRPRQEIVAAGTWILPLVDLAALPRERRPGEARRRLAAEGRRPFRLAAELPLRAHLWRLAGEEHVLFVNTHHVASDGWSQGIMNRELTLLYEAFARGAPSPLPEPAVQYADFAAWQRDWLRGEVLEGQLTYWRRQLDGLQVLELPADRSRPAVRTPIGASLPLALPEELSWALRQRSVEAGASLYMTLLAAFVALLHRLTGQSDVAVGSPIANRHYEEIETLIGFFVNTLVLRSRPRPRQSFDDLLAQTRQLCLDAYLHQDLPFEKLVEELDPERDLRNSPFFQVMLTVQNAPAKPPTLPGVELSPFLLDTVKAPFDLDVSLFETGGEIRGFLTYSTELFHPTTALRLARQYETVLRDVVAEASQPLQSLVLLTAAERQQSLVEWNGRPSLPSSPCLHELFEAQAEKAPEAVAVVFAGERLSYAELDRRANRLAHELRSLGVAPEDRIAISIERSPAMLVGILGVLKAGAAYLPLDPAYPAAHLLFLLEDSGAKVLVVSAGLRDRFAAADPGIRRVLIERGGPGSPERPSRSTTPRNLAYMIYTSGSTGRPKAVAVEHRSAVHLARRAAAEYPVRAGDRVLQFASLSFDTSVEEIFPTLLCGATLVLRDGGVPTVPELLARIAELAVTVLDLPTAYWHELVAQAEAEGLALPAGLRLCIIGGERVSGARLRSWRRLVADRAVRLINGYGPTEATVTSTWCAPSGSDESPSIGRPFAGVTAYVLDPSMKPAEWGAAGELFLGGAGLARGYHGRPALTAGAFLPNPFDPSPGRRLYRTGDRVRRLSDGRLTFLGRLDDQVKVRGYRIEPGEIEAALVDHPEVRQAAVVARPAPGSDTSSLLGFFVPERAAPDGGPSQQELRRFLSARLPAYMIPMFFLRVGEVPLTPSGKVDRRALASGADLPSVLEVGNVAPRTPSEEILTEIWKELLGFREAGIRDNFFELGGHSLLATQVVSRIRRAFGVELPVRSVFERPTVSELAAEVDDRRRAGPAGGAVTAPLVARPPGTGELPLSFAQQRLWFLQQLTPSSSVYNMPDPRRLLGRLDVAALQGALGEIVRRHEVLRTRFPAPGGRPRQEIVAPGAWVLPLVDLTALPRERRPDEARRRLAAEGRRPFRLAVEMPLRSHLWRLGAGEHVLFVDTHHVASDGWSFAIMNRELTALYEACVRREPSPLPEPRVQYADFALWQREWLREEALEAQLAYWRRQLEGLAVLELPADRPRPAVQTHTGESLPLVLPEELGRSLRRLSVEAGASLYMTLLAAFVALLHRLTGQDDVAVGSPIANRRHEEVEDLIGFFVNTLVLRSRPRPRQPFRDLLARVREVCLDAYLYQDVPFEKLVEELDPQRDLGRSPLFQVMLVLQNAPNEGVSMAGVAVSGFPLGASRAHFDLTASLQDDGEGLVGALSYNVDLFDRTTMARLVRRFKTLFESLVEAPDQSLGSLPLLGGAERHQLLREWNDTAVERSADRTVVGAFDRQAAATPDAAAVVFGDVVLSYRELRSRAERLAYRLRHLGVGPDARVGLAVRRSPEMATAVLAVLKAGAAYVPLDPSYPKERLRFMLAETESSNPGAIVVLTEAALRDGVAALAGDSTRLVCLEDGGDGPAAPLPEPEPESLAYVIYTSGSTGRPKGIALSHGALWNLVEWHLNGAGLLRGARMLQYASLSFDASFHEIFATWCSGGTLHVVSEELRRDVPALGRYLVEQRIEKAILPVVVLHRLAEECLEHGLDLSAFGELVTTGEQLHVTPGVTALFERYPHVGFHNHYGPSETHVVTAARLAGSPSSWPSHPSIGRPVARTRIHLLDARLHPVGIGAVGELHVGGASLARGYVLRPALSAEKLLPDPFAPEPGGRLYRTGDQARWLAGGTIEFLGRLDHQVKIRGFRVEVGEVEAVLAQHPGVREAAVVVCEDAGAGSAERWLAGFLVAPGPPSGLRAFLGERLPSYMVPRSLTVVEALPLSPTGKVDRGELRRRAAAEEPRTEPGRAAARTPSEEMLAEIWEQLLGIREVGVHDDFFGLGGHSLLATQVVSRVRRLFAVELPVKSVFERPTVAELAAEIDARRREKPLGAAVTLPLAPRPPGIAELPLSFAQQRLWFLQELTPSSPVYNMPVAWHLLGRLDAAALHRALAEILRRHEALRTRFPVTDGRPRQEVSDGRTWSLPLVDLTALPRKGRLCEARCRLAAESRRVFRLAVELPLRSHLWRLATDEHALFVNVHHIASDGWSQGIFDRELAALYDAFVGGAPSPLPELGVQYADFAVWQHEWLGGERLQAHLGLWREHLAGLPILELPADRPRPAALTYRGATQQMALPAALSERLKKLSVTSGTSLFMTLLAGFLTLLRRLTAQRDFAVGVPIANRQYEKVEELIGFFVNTLVLRADFSWESTAERPSFGTLLHHVREWCLEAYDHQDVPFEKLVEELDPERSRNHTPLVQVIFQHLVAQTSAGLSGLKLRPLVVKDRMAKFDLVVNMVDSHQGMTGQWRYSTDLFDATTLGRMKGHYTVLLTAAAADPERAFSELPLLSAPEAHQLLAEWNVRTPAPPPSTLHALFAARAAERPAATAVVFGNERLSYGELDRRSNQLAHYLRGLGVGPETLVGLFLERSLEMVTAILGVLKAGGAYVPLDPVYPRKRIAFLLEDVHVPILITQEELLDRLPGHRAEALCIDGEWERIRRAPATVPRVAESPENLAYVIYTSGSTGRPKGVAVPHAQVVRLLASTDAWFHFGPADVWTSFHSFAFDFSVWELWGALAFGGRLEVVPYWTSRSPEAFHELVTRAGVTVLNQTPSAFQQFLRADEARRGGARPAHLRLVIFGGEALDMESLAPWFARHGDRHPRLVNMYGITETTVHVTYRPLGRADLKRMPGTSKRWSGSVIGRRIPDLSLYLFDQYLRPVPIGVPGEVHVGGAGVVRGYLNRRALTAEHFVPDPGGGLPAPGARLYKTGDLARLRPDGDLEYLGRIDHQVKIRGFRVELGEVEENLLRHPAVAEAVIMTHGEGSQETSLVAYVVTTAGEAEPTLSEIRSFLGGFLPQYMLPSSLVALDVLPLTAQGKVDRRALPAPSSLRAAASGDPPAPRDEVERFLTRLWRETLDLDPQAPIGIHDNFFELGGNSIRGAMMVNRLQQKLGEIVQVVTIFDAPTIAELGRYLREQHPVPVRRLFNEKQPAVDRAAYRVVDARRVAKMRSLVGSRPFCKPGPKNPPAIFLLAPPRSGTTLLRIMLGGHPAIFAPGELELLSFDTLAERRNRFTGRDRFWLEGLTRAMMEIHGCDAEKAEEITARCEAERLTTQAFYGRLQSWLGERRLLDKTPSYALDLEILRRAEAWFENALYIHLCRHPYGMIRSFEEAKLDQIFFRTKHPFKRRELAELIWLVSQENILRFLEGVPAARQYRVTFEELVHHPRPVMERLCAFLRIELEPSMVEPYREPGRRMSDGLHAQSRMLGDVKFHQHDKIDAGVAERWKMHHEEDFLGRPTWDMAMSLGYPRVAVSKSPQPRPASSGAPPLSFAQERLWFLQQLKPSSPVYNIPIAERLTGHLDIAALTGALGEVVRRHEALRTLFVAPDGQPRQVVADAASWALPLVDLAALPGRRRLDEARRRLAAEARRPFRLAAELPLRSLLWRLAEQEHVLFVNTHHIASDGWSQGIFCRELTVLYEAAVRATPSPLPELPLQYADFAVWQREWLRGETLVTQLAYWREQLDRLAGLELPTDRPRSSALTEAAGAAVEIFFSEELSRSLRKLSVETGASLFMTLLSAWIALLHRLTGHNDIAVGTPIAGRNHKEIETLIGFFVNTLVLRGRPAPQQPFRDLLAQVRKLSLGAYRHQDLPFEKLVEALEPERHLGRSPLFQVMLTLQQNAPGASLRLPDVEVSTFLLASVSAHYELTVSLNTAGDRLRAYLIYDKCLFHRTRIRRLARHFEALLSAIVEDPSRALTSLPLLGVAERHQLLQEWSGTPAPGGEACLGELFEAQAARTPGAVALVSGGERWSYRELAARARELAARLRRLGVGPEVVVAVTLEREAETVAAILAVLLAGGAYLPLDPRTPPERREWVLGESGAAALLTPHEIVTRRTPAAVPGKVVPGNAAYVLYTSGSTGRPKGVVVEHRQVSSYVFAVRERLALSPGASFALVQPLSVDSSKTTLYPPLLSGGRLYLVDEPDATDPAALARLFQRERIDVLKIAPSHLAALAEGAGALEFLPAQALVLGGEAWPGDWESHWGEALGRCRVYNHYGPTEVTVGTHAGRVTVGGSASAGRPLGNSEAYVVDARLHPVAAGVPGELLLGGAGLARGYLGRPGRTAASFVPHPFADERGARLYKSGDLARLRHDGTLEVLGRRDEQVKVRGYRVEPGEVEAALGDHPGIAASAVAARGEPARLVVYLRAASKPAPELAELRRFLRPRLPEHMLPEALVILDELPRTPHGKIDRGRLPEPAPQETVGLGTEEPPRNPSEKAVAEIWEELLGLREIGIGDDFFLLGGHSLLATRVVSRIRRAFGIELPVRSVFERPTVAELAAEIDSRWQTTVADVPASLVVTLQEAGHETPFFFVHPVGGGVFCYAELARYLGPARPFYAVEARGYEGHQIPHDELTSMAADYLAAIRERCGELPRWLGGWSFGGVVAFEMACQLRQAGRPAPGLVLVDSSVPKPTAGERDEAGLLGSFARHLGLDAANRRRPWTLDRICQRGVAEGLWSAEAGREQSERFFRLYRANLEALASYSPRSFDGSVGLFRAREAVEGNGEPKAAGWDRLAAEVEVRIVPGNHFSMIRKPHVETLAEQLRRYLETHR